MRRGLVFIALVLMPFFHGGAIEANVVGFESISISDEVLDEINAGYVAGPLADSGSKIILWDENGRAFSGTLGDFSGIRIEINVIDE